MERRTLLGAIGIGSMAGCLSQPPPGNTPAGQPTDSSPTPINRNMTERATVGNGTHTDDGYRKSHVIVLKNATAYEHTGTLVIRHPDGSIIHNETDALRSESVVIVSLTDPLEYTAMVNLPDTDVTETTTVELQRFDCNWSSMTFDILAADRIKAKSVSELVLCTNLEIESVDTGQEYTGQLGDGNLPVDDRKSHHVQITNPTDDEWTTRLVLERDGELLLDGLNTLQTEAEFPNSGTDTPNKNVETTLRNAHSRTESRQQSERKIVGKQQNQMRESRGISPKNNL